MQLTWKLWRAVLPAVLAVVALSVAFASPVLAAEPGEWGHWTPEQLNGGQAAGEFSPPSIQDRGTVSEARNNGHELESWRGLDSQVWFSLDNTEPFTIGLTTTGVSPAVVAWGPSLFAVFHTGTDGHIYWSWVFPNGACRGCATTGGSWDQVPGQTTNMAVSVAQLGAGESQLYMTYRGVGDDQRVFGTEWNGSSWVNTHPIAGALTPSAPSITDDNGVLFDAVRGEDNQVYVISSFNGGLSWPNAASPQGGTTFDSPHIAASPDGNMIVSQRGTDNKIYYREFNFVGEPESNWSGDVTGWQTNDPIELTPIGNAIFAVVTGLNTTAYFKQVISS